MIIFLLGKPNSGKGTQALKIVEKYKMVHINVGEELRSWVSQDQRFIAQKVEQDLNSGAAVPICIAIKAWMNKLISLSADDSILFEGSPRKLLEAEAMLEYFDWLKIKILVIYIDIPDEEIRHRSAIRRYCPKCGRTYSLAFTPDITKCQDDQSILTIRNDDKPEVVENRIKVFHNEIMPTINFFQDHGMLHTIDGIGSLEEVFQRIDQVIKNFLS